MPNPTPACSPLENLLLKDSRNHKPHFSSFIHSAMGVDMRRLSPWGPPSAKPTKRKFEVRVAVARLEGLAWPVFGEGDTAAVRVRWNGPNSRFGRRKKADTVTGRAAVGASGVAEFRGCGNGFGCVSGPDPLGDWEVCFSALHAKGQKEKKLEEIGTKSVNLGDWLRVSGINAEVEGKRSQLQVHKKQIPITLRKNGLIAEATLHIDVSLVEIRKSKETSDTQVLSANEDTKEEGETTDDSCTFDQENSELGQLLLLGDETEEVAGYKSRIGTASTNNTSANTSSSSSARSSPDQLLGSVSKRRFLPWGKSSKIASKSYDDSERGSDDAQPSSDSSSSKESAESSRAEDPIGSWESMELISRDRQTKLKSQTFFASIDQRDESAGGESACTALVAVIANALHSKAAHTPTRSEFDTLIRQGSSEWQKLCNDGSYMNRFHNKHFDLDTILEARVRPISVLLEKSFIGFFQPESFQSLHGAMSFDDIWNEISSDAGREPRIYIVSWNDHFFVLKVDSDAYYIIDTLGERLFEGCTKAYMLKFEGSTEMYSLPDNSEEGGGGELICSGKECCKEFIKRFLAAIPLREELEMEEKGTGNPHTALHQRLQIEFHLTEATPSAVIVDDIAWW